MMSTDCQVSEEQIGYEIGKWYMVEIDYEVFIPAKFIGLRRVCPRRDRDASHNFPHPGEAIFENVKIFMDDCGFKGENWVDSHYSGGRYTSFKPRFRSVTENELWAVQVIERFQEIVAGRKKSFSVEMANGFVFEGKIKPPKKKDNLPGKYYAELVNPKTGENRKGSFEYDGKSESAPIFLLSRFSGWHIKSVKQLKPDFALTNPKD